MSTNFWLFIAALSAGLMIPLQGVINGRLGEYIGGPIQAALVSFGVGFIALIIINLALRHPIPAPSAVSGAPAWIWIGGLMGVVMVTLSATAVPRIGVATYVSALIAGQLTAAIVYDHFGVLGQEVHEATPLRLLGVVFLAIGVILIRRF